MDNIVLKEHQKRVVDKMADPKRKGLLVYHGLGSGKTITSILAANKLDMKATVVVPASLRENFAGEINKVKAPKEEFDITSYEKYQRNPAGFKGDMLILDEAHRIKNSTSKRSKAITRNSKNYKKRLLLTGTPIQNKPYEIAPLINTAAGKEKLPNSEKAFNKRYLKTVQINPSVSDYLFKGSRPYKKKVAYNLEDFRSKVHGLVDYHNNKNSEDFPTVTRRVSKVMMSDKQTDTYNFYEGKLSTNLRRSIAQGISPENKDMASLNSFLSATRQISNSSKKFTTDKKTVSPKIRAISRRIRQSDRPSLVYSNFLESGINPLSKVLTKHKVSNAVYTGELSDSKKSALVKKYNSGKIKALLVSSAGGEGLDLKNTGTVHIMEPHWHEPKVDQVIGRAVRYKSHASLPRNKRHVDVYKYLSDIPNKQTADEYLYEMGKQKKELNNKFLNILKQEGSK